MRVWNLQRYDFVNGRPVPEFLCADGSWSRFQSQAFPFASRGETDDAKKANACKDEKGNDHLLFAMPVSEKH